MKTHKYFHHNIVPYLIGVALLVALLTISKTVAAQPRTGQKDFPVPVSVNALMVTLIDHSAHYIWDYGALDREVTEEEWQAVEYYAIQLSASGPLISLGGTGIMDDTWAETDEWWSYSRAMTNASMLALDAARNKNRTLLMSAGNILLDTCLGCHEAFKPAVPTEGIMHQPTYDYLYHLFEVE